MSGPISYMMERKAQRPAWFAGAQSVNGRREKDHYPTPPEATVALLGYLHIPAGAVVWECACGDGLMAETVKKQGYNVVASDKFDYGYGAGGVDFLTAGPPEQFDWIITNPPFSMAESFIRRAWETGRPFAFLLKAQFWNAAKRLRLFEDCTPSAILPLTWRLNFTGGSGSFMDTIWVVWDRAGKETRFVPLKRPD